MQRDLLSKAGGAQVSVRVVISQSMYFPWVGLMEQRRLADIFVHYDDVQFSKGSFSNRVQVKTAKGLVWMTIPLRDLHLGQRINEVQIDERRDWRAQHQELLTNAYQDAPYVNDMLALVRQVHSSPAQNLVELARASMIALWEYFDLNPDCKLIDVEKLAIPGASSQRVHDVVRALAGNVYITGHGAKNYLEHDLFENSAISVEYMDYQRAAYSQLHGEFTPYLSALDLVANCGKEGREMIRSGSINWKAFIGGGV